MTRWERLWIDADVATMDPARGPWGAVRDGAVACAGGRLAWVGSRNDLPGRPEALADEVREAEGRWITPGLVDCHTHLVFAGDRVDEWERRSAGASYEEIARAGGGILSTVRATRAASAEGLFEAAVGRLRDLAGEGVTTVEVKSGYGLDRDTELRMLEVGRRLGREAPVDVRTTFLGLHAVPPEFASDRDGYVELALETLREAHGAGLVDHADAFHESIAFSAAECERLFDAARALGVPVRLHADQLTDAGGARLAAGAGALSADHLERTSEEGVRAMAGAGTVAVLLPAAAYFLRDAHRPPVEAFRRHGVPMAVATDLNPGSSPARSLLLAANMAVTLFGLSPEEAFAGVTREGARALGLDDRGVLSPGARADLCVFDVASPAELVYWIGNAPLAEVATGGVPRIPGADPGAG